MKAKWKVAIILDDEIRAYIRERWEQVPEVLKFSFEAQEFLRLLWTKNYLYDIVLEQRPKEQGCEQKADL